MYRYFVSFSYTKQKRTFNGNGMYALNIKMNNYKAVDAVQEEIEEGLFHDFGYRDAEVVILYFTEIEEEESG